MSDINSDNRRIAKNTLLLYCRSIFLIIISLYTSRVTLEALGVEDFGIYNLVGGVVAMFSMLSNTMAASSQRFITYALGEGNYQKLRQVFSSCVTLHIFLGLILTGLLEVVGVWFISYKLNIPAERISTAFWVFQFSLLTFFIGIISVPYNALIVAHEKMSAFAYISICEAIFKLVIVGSLLILPFDRLWLYSLMLSLVAISIRVIYSVYCSKHFEESVGVKFKVDPILLKEMFKFSGWNLIGNSALVIRNYWIDIVLNIFFGVTVNAAKGVCNQVQGAIYQFVTNFQAALTPQLTKSVAKNDFSRTHELIIQGGRFSFYLLMLFAVPVIININGILHIWLVEVPQYSVEFIRWTFIFLLLDGLSRFIITAILAQGNIRNYQIALGGSKLLALPIVYMFLLFGAGPVIGVQVTVFVEILAMCVSLIFAKKLINLPVLDYLKQVILHGWCVFLLCLSLCFYISTFLDNFFINTIVSCCITVFFILFLGLRKTERVFLYAKILKRIQ